MKRNITPKQIEVLQLIADGYTSEEIAIKLGNSKKTIDSIRLSMLEKFQAKNATQLVALGFREGWLK